MYASMAVLMPWPTRRPNPSWPEIRAEVQRVILHVGEAPIELHPFAGELSQIDIAPTIAPGDIVIGFAAHLFFHRMIVHRHAVIPMSSSQSTTSRPR